MRSIERVIAEGSGHGYFIANGCYGKVYHHGGKRVYKRAMLDGTAVWLERCFAIQKRLGLSHPLCAMMPEIFSFRYTKHGYEIVMAKYTKIGDPGSVLYNSCPAYSKASTDIVDAVLGRSSDGYTFADDMHRGNILHCSKRGWIITDPSCSSYAEVTKGVQDPKFMRAKRTAPVYGPQRSH